VCTPKGGGHAPWRIALGPEGPHAFTTMNYSTTANSRGEGVKGRDQEIPNKNDVLL